MGEYYAIVRKGESISHHGIHGQKWGIRRFQNPDGTLTEAGKKRYGANSVDEISSAKGLQRRLNDVDKSIARNTYDASKALNKAGKRQGFSTGEKNTKKLMEAQKNIEAGKAETEELLKKVSEGGYTSLTIPTRRAVGSKGEAVARSILATGIVNAVLLPFGRIGAMVSVPSVSGKNYRVKDVQKKATANKQQSQEDMDRAAHKMAEKYGHSDGDDWKIYREATAGDPRAQKIVDDWTTEHKKKKKNS